MSDTTSVCDSGLFDAAQVFLFGKRFKSIRYMEGGSADRSTSERRFARIYAFSFEGHYYKLPRPMVFLVKGKGAEPQDEHGAFKASETGIESKGFKFASDIHVWEMNRLEATVCMDIEAGRLDELLLAPALASEEGGSGRSAAASRSVMAARSVAAFRSVMVGPHQE